MRNVSLLGAGERETVIEGTLFWPRTGSAVSHLTVTDGPLGGVRVGAGEAPHISSCTLERNRGPGALYCVGGSPVLEDCTIVENLSTGVYCGEGSSPIFRRCTISGNSGRSAGGVRLSRCPATFIDCTVLGNLGVREAGGVSAVSASPTLINCVLAGNLCAGEEEYSTGGILAGLETARPTLINCNICDNVGVQGGVGCYDGSAPTLTNCIVWRNVPGALCGRETHCLSRDDPRFVHPGTFDFERFKTVTIGGEECQLPDFVVDVPDYRLRPDSPAIDAGTSDGAPETDIAGCPRCREEDCDIDIGIHEYVDSETRFVRGDCNGDGDSAGEADAVFLLQYLFLGSETPPCLAACDVDTDGDIASVTDAIYILSFHFLGGPAPRSPFPECGAVVLDTDVELGCETPPEICSR
jgi:hypothetical protein